MWYMPVAPIYQSRNQYTLSRAGANAKPVIYASGDARLVVILTQTVLPDPGHKKR